MSVKSGGLSLKEAWFALGVMIAVICFGIFDRQAIYLMAAPIAKSLNLSMTQLGMAKGLGAAVFSTLAIYPLGWLGDRVGRRLTLSICVAIWGAGTAACGFAMNYPQFFAAVVAIAAAESGLGPLTASMVPDIFPEEKRASANAIFSGGLTLGASASLLLLGVASSWVETHHAGLPDWLQGWDSWRLMFLIAGLPTPIFLLLVVVAKLDRPNRRHREKAAPSSPSGFWPYLKANAGPLALVLGAMTVCGIGSDTGHAWIAIALARIYGVSPATNGYGLGIAAAVGAVTSILATGLVMRVVRRRYGDRAPLRVIIAGMATLILPAALMVFIRTPWQAFALEALQLTIGAVFAALSFYITQDLAPPGLRGQLFALNSIISKPFSGLSVTLVGVVSDQLPNDPRNLLVAAALVSIACLTLGCVLLRLAEQPYLRLREKYAAKERPETADRSAPPALQESPNPFAAPGLALASSTAWSFLMAEIEHVTDSAFDAEVLASSKPVLVDFYADWCAPCRALMPALEDIAREYGAELAIKKLNVDDNVATRDRYNITSIPALLFFRNGELRERVVGPASRTAIATAVDQLLASPT